MGGDAPGDEADIAATVAAAYAAREPIEVEGAGTKRGMLRPVQAARSVSTRKLRGITLYAPKELVISARAGTPVAEIEAAVAEHGQHLIGEPPDLSGLLGTTGQQTIGGIIATNLSGPRRVAWGAMRDHVLGIRAVDGAGAIFHSGGRVLKNVTGLDLCKLLTGSHGTLGVMTEITLKVLPAPECTGTLVLPGLDATRAVAALSAGLGSPYSVSAAAWLPREAAARVPALAGFAASVALLRIEEFTASVAYRTGRLATDLQPFGHAELLGDTLSRAAWRAVRDAVPLAAEPGDAIWRVSVRPSSGPGILSATGLAGFPRLGRRPGLARRRPGRARLRHSDRLRRGRHLDSDARPRQLSDCRGRHPARTRRLGRDHPPGEGGHGPGGYPQPRPPHRGSLILADQLHRRTTARPRNRHRQWRAPHLRALRHVHRDLPDLRPARRRVG